MSLEVRVLDAVSRIPQSDWDALVGEGSPFLEHTFLTTLEDAGCVGPGTGWTPCPITVWRGGRLVGAAPSYLKSHSYGEFVYDWQWASFARQNGIKYYPKVVVAAPFSPVVGSRLLTDEPEVQAALIAGLRKVAAKTAGLHVLFPNAEDSAALEAAGGMLRLQWQYHWENQEFRTFEDFLATLPTKKRTAIRKERRAVEHIRVVASVGSHPPDTAALMWRLYEGTHLRHTGGEGYLNERFFQLLFERWAHRIHTVVAHEGDERIAGTFNVLKGDRLYGRHWGALREVPFLHFEVAIYAAVEFCIQNGIRWFEPGHGGEHKRSRGFAPRLTRSTHWLTHPGLDAALRDFCAREAAAVLEMVHE